MKPRPSFPARFESAGKHVRPVLPTSTVPPKRSTVQAAVQPSAGLSGFDANRRNMVSKLAALTRTPTDGECVVLDDERAGRKGIFDSTRAVIAKWVEMNGVKP